MSGISEDGPLIYRIEVLSIIGALADIVVELRAIRDDLRGEEENGGEEEQ